MKEGQPKSGLLYITLPYMVTSWWTKLVHMFRLECSDSANRDHFDNGVICM